MAECAGASPKKRRRSVGAAGSVSEVVTAENIRQIHLLQERKEVSVQGYILAVDGELQARREVGSFILADTECLVQVSLWADVAKKMFPKVLEWLDMCEDGKFPQVEVTSCQVCRFRSPCGKELRRLQSTARTTLKLLASGPLLIQPTAAVLTENAADLMTAPFVSCFRGTVSRVEAVTHTREDVPMKEIGVTIASGWEVPVMLFDIQTEEEVKVRDGVVIWFGEHRPGLPGREDSKGYVWLYSSGYLLNLGEKESPVHGRKLNIAGPLTELEVSEEEGVEHES